MGGLTAYNWNNTKQVAYVDAAGTVHELYKLPGQDWDHANLTEIVTRRGRMVPRAARLPYGTDLIGYDWSFGRSKQLVYLDGDGDVHELYCTVESGWDHANLTGLLRGGGGASPPRANPLGGFTAYQWVDGGTKEVSYFDTSGVLHRFSAEPTWGWSYEDLSPVIHTAEERTNLPWHSQSLHVFGQDWAELGSAHLTYYGSSSGHIHDLHRIQGEPWQALDITTAAESMPPGAGHPRAYSFESTRYVTYIDVTGRIHEVSTNMPLGQPWRYVNLNTLVADASPGSLHNDFCAFSWYAGRSRHIIYVSRMYEPPPGGRREPFAGYLNELLHDDSTGRWQYRDLTNDFIERDQVIPLVAEGPVGYPYRNTISVYYVSEEPSGHIHELTRNRGENWTYRDLTARIERVRRRRIPRAATY